MEHISKMAHTHHSTDVSELSETGYNMSTVWVYNAIKNEKQKNKIIR